MGYCIYDSRHLLRATVKICIRSEYARQDGWNEPPRPFRNQNLLLLRPFADTRYPALRYTTNLGPEVAHDPFACEIFASFTCINGNHNDSISLPGDNGFLQLHRGMSHLYKSGIPSKVLSCVDLSFFLGVEHQLFFLVLPTRSGPILIFTRWQAASSQILCFPLSDPLRVLPLACHSVSSSLPRITRSWTHRFVSSYSCNDCIDTFTTPSARRAHMKSVQYVPHFPTFSRCI